MATLIDVDPFAPEFRVDPFPVYRECRERGPLLQNANGDYYITRYADCAAILRDHERWSNDGSNSRYAQEARANLDPEIAQQGALFEAVNARPMLFTDPPDHTRLRGLVNKAFTPRQIERLRPRMEAIVDELLDEVVGAGTMDIIQQVAYPLPVIMIAELLGVPSEDRELLKSWSEPLAATLDPNLDVELMQAAASAGLAFIAYFAQLINERRASPRDDLISALIEAEESGDSLRQEELIVNLMLLLIAGHETTTNLIGNGMLALFRNPDQAARLRQDPSLVKTAVEELLRYDGPVHLNARTALCDVEVAGEIIPKGEQPVMLLAGANRDPAEFDRPDTLDIGRVENRHLAFSTGIHFCVGASLARAEGQTAISAMLRRLPDLALAEDPPPYKDNATLRGMSRLLVSF